VSVAAWSETFHVTASNDQPRLRALSKRAEARHDPEGLVFVAARLQDTRESARLAEEAVRLDPNLLWAYVIVARAHPNLAEVHHWIPKLEHWDPQNALFYLITAESIDTDHFSKASKVPPNERQEELQWGPLWQTAMVAAFASPKFDDYLDRLRELDRRVVSRYGFNDPYAVLWGEEETVWPINNAQQFAKSRLQLGQDLQARGDRKRAAEEYWAVARFGQMIDSQGHSRLEHWLGTALQAMAYKRLQSFSAKEGNSSETALFTYLAERFDPVRGMHTWFRDDWVFGQETSRRNATVLQIASLMMLVFCGLMVVAAPILMASSRRGARRAAERGGPVATLVTLASTMGLLLSSATIYLTYRPYWYIFQHAILKGDRSQARDLLDFLIATRMLPGLVPGSDLSLNLPVYFWAGVTLLGVISLLLILLRHFQGVPRSNGLQHNPQAP